MPQSSRRSTFKVLVAERLEQRFVFDGSTSLAEWGMGNDMLSLKADTAYVSQLDSLIALKPMPTMSNLGDVASPEFRIQLDGWPIAQEIRDNRLFLVMNRPDGTGIVEEFDVSDMLSPERIASVEIPSIVNAADFFGDVLVLQTMDRDYFREMAPAMTLMESVGSIDLSELAEVVKPWTDGFYGVFPPTTIQILELDRLSHGVIASQPFSSPIERVFFVGNELFAVTSNAFAPASMIVDTEMDSQDFDPLPPPPFFAPPSQTIVEHFHFDTQSGTLTFEETFSFDGMIMATDMWQSDSTAGIALLVQSFTDMSYAAMPYAAVPYAFNGRVSIEGFSLNAKGNVDRERIPVTLPLGDNWVSSFEFSDGKAVLASPQGLTLVDATGTGPIVSTSLTYQNQFSSWAQLDTDIYLRIANAIDSGNGSIAGHSVVLDVLDVSDFSRPKTIVSRTFGDSDASVNDWTWSVVENHVLKQAEGKYLLIIPTSSMSTEALNTDPATDGDLISMEPISLPWSLDSKVQLVSISVSQESSAAIDLVGDFTISGPISAAHLDGDVLTTMGYGEFVVVRMSQKPLSPIRIALQYPMIADAPVNEVDASLTTMTRNLANPTDTNSDGDTNQLDVLLLINELNLRGSYVLKSNSEINRSVLADVNGDQWLTPLDVLVIINWINRASDTGLNGEAEYDGAAQVSQSTVRLPFVALQAETEPTRVRTKSIDDTFASLSIDWNLGNDDLSGFLPAYSKLNTRSFPPRFRQASR